MNNFWIQTPCSKQGCLTRWYRRNRIKNLFSMTSAGASHCNQWIAAWALGNSPKYCREAFGDEISHWDDRRTLTQRRNKGLAAVRSPIKMLWDSKGWRLGLPVSSKNTHLRWEWNVWLEWKKISNEDKDNRPGWKGDPLRGSLLKHPPIKEVALTLEGADFGHWQLPQCDRALT